MQAAANNDWSSLAGRDGALGAHPRVPAADERAHILDAAFLEHERRTGARELVVSGVTRSR